MVGTVEEWTSPFIDGASTTGRGAWVVAVRGGSWYHGRTRSRATARVLVAPGDAAPYRGFRTVTRPQHPWKVKMFHWHRGSMQRREDWDRLVRSRPFLQFGAADLSFDCTQGPMLPGAPASNSVLVAVRRAPLTAGKYHLRVRTNGGARVRLDGESVLDVWLHGDKPLTYSVSRTLGAGMREVTVEFHRASPGLLLEFTMLRSG